jgi:serine/threonine protein kinase
MVVKNGVGALAREGRYRAYRERRGETPVFIKVPVEPTDERSAESLRHEHQILRGLEVPGVVRSLALEERDGVPALVLEDAGEEDLAGRLARGPLDTEAFLALAPQMAAAVGHVHKRNVLHCNLNPASFVLCHQGKTVTLVDFADATTVAGQITPCQSRSLAYTAPEQTGRLRQRPDQRADLYSLGAIFYEMLTGRPPFPSTDSVELVHAHLAVNPVAPAIMNPAIPRPLSDIALRLLAKSPEERYQSAEAVVADLEEARARWRAGGTIEPFELARDELARELPLPARLYARDAEVTALTRALERVLDGGRVSCSR